MFFFCCIITIGENYSWKTLILDKVCSYVEVKSSSPSFHFFIGQPSMGCLPSPSLRSPSLSTLPSSSTSLPYPFQSSLYSFFSQNLPYSPQTFPFPSQSSPFSPNLPRSYFSFSLPISFPIYLLSYLSPSLLIYFLSSPFLFSAVTLTLFLFTFFFPCFPFPSPFPFSFPFPFSSPPLDSFISFSLRGGEFYTPLNWDITNIDIGRKIAYLFVPCILLNYDTYFYFITTHEKQRDTYLRYLLWSSFRRRNLLK